jgi:GH25 family lysozyme M1 (1,4-beta-N-acetylmuramidase)
MPGIDVSYYQGEIDWKKVKASGIEFAMIRLGYRGYGEEGKLVEDKMAFRNIEGALDAGLQVGIYFFSQAITVEEALEEAEFVLKRIKVYDITMPVVYDWEYISEEARTAKMDRRTLTDCYKAFCGRIAEAGYTPMAYFNTYQSRHLMFLHELEDFPFWLALYSDRMTFPYRFEMWQYTDSGIVPGIEGKVDINLYFTDEYF